MSYTAVAIVLTIAAVVFYAAIVLYGARIDGKRQALRNKGLHPVTKSGGQVEAREFAAEDSEAREQEHGRNSDQHQNHQG